MKYRLIMLISLLALVATGAFACEFSFTLVDADGEEQKLKPQTDIHLDVGEIYILKVDLTEDHRRCLLSPEDTEFLLDEEKWKTSKEYLSLRLIDEIIWKDVASREHIAEIKFRATTSGTSELEILRVCTRGGYDDVLLFVAE